MNAIKELNELVKRYEGFTAQNLEGIKKDLECYKLLILIEESILEGRKFAVPPDRYEFYDYEIDFLKNRGFKINKKFCVHRVEW